MMMVSLNEWENHDMHTVLYSALELGWRFLEEVLEYVTKKYNDIFITLFQLLELSYQSPHII